MTGKLRDRVKFTVAVLVVAVAMASCGGSTPSFDEAGAEQAIELVKDLSKVWNDNALTWVAAYTDPSVGWEEFLRIQQDVLVAQAKNVATARVQVSQLPPDLQEPVSDIIDHYANRMLAFQAWTDAIVTGDLAGEEKAVDAYQSISSPPVIIPLLENFVDTPTIRAAFESEGVTSEEFMKAMFADLPDF